MSEGQKQPTPVDEDFVVGGLLIPWDRVWRDRDGRYVLQDHTQGNYSPSRIHGRLEELRLLLSNGLPIARVEWILSRGGDDKLRQIVERWLEISNGLHPEERQLSPEMMDYVAANVR